MSEEPSAAILEAERSANEFNGQVGHVLLSVSERARVWSIHLRPGERIGYHRHVLDYFWVCHSFGRSLSHQEHGERVETSYKPGDIMHHKYPVGGYKLHDLMNIGDTDLSFTTVEYLDSANGPLPLPKGVAPAREEKR